MATKAENKSIFEAAREIATAESPLGKKMQFLEYSRPHIEAVEKLLAEIEARYKIIRFVGEGIFGGEDGTKLTREVQSLNKGLGGGRFFYGDLPSDEQERGRGGGFHPKYRYGVSHYWRIDLDYSFYIEVRLYIYKDGDPYFIADFRKKTEYGCNIFPLKEGGSAQGESVYSISMLRDLLGSAFAQYMKLNNLLEVKIHDVKVKKAGERQPFNANSPEARVAPEYLVKYEVVGGKDEEIETNCPKCNGDYGGKFAQVCPFCGVSRKVFYVRKDGEIK